MSRVVWCEHVGRNEYPVFYEGANNVRVGHNRGIELINAGAVVADAKLLRYFVLRYKNVSVVDGVVVVDGLDLLPMVKKIGFRKRRTISAIRHDRLMAAKQKRLIEKARAEKIEMTAEHHKINGSRMSSVEFKDFLNKYNLKF